MNFEQMNLVHFVLRSVSLFGSAKWGRCGSRKLEAISPDFNKKDEGFTLLKNRRWLPIGYTSVSHLVHNCVKLSI